MAHDGLTREFIAERDVRIMKARQSGTPVGEIARRFQMSVAAVNAAIRRQLEKLNREALLAYPEVLRLELERLDALQQAMWPLTQHRRVTLPDGTEMTVEPDQKAVQTVLSIMDRRAKLLGMGVENVAVAVTGSPEPVRAALAGADRAAASDAFDPETEARRLLEIMGRTRVLPPETVAEILGDLPALGSPEIPDAEVVEAEVVEGGTAEPVPAPVGRDRPTVEIVDDSRFGGTAR